MKSIIIIISIITISAVNLFGQYGITDPNSLRSEAFIQITATVDCVPITVTPHLTHPNWDPFVPGDNVVYGEDEVPLGYFGITFAKGYNHSVQYTVDAVNHPEGPEVMITTYGQYTPGNTQQAQMFNIQSGVKQSIIITISDVWNGNLEIFASSINVPEGAYAGERKWNITCTAEYEE